MTTRGIPEVPMGLEASHHRFLTDIRQQLIDLRQAQAPLAIPTNFRATGQALSVVLQWTRVTNADYYEILWNGTASLAGANIIDAGNASEYTNYIGIVGIKRFYYVRARKNSGARSLESTVTFATTLAAAAGVTPPVPPPPSHIIVTDQTTGHQIPYALYRPGRNYPE